MKSNLAKTLVAGTAAAGLAAGAALATAPAANAATGTKPLSAVLTADGNRFDQNGRDFDIVTEAVLTVLKAKPSSDVSVLTKGKVALTAFIPTDNAFKRLVGDLTGKTAEQALHMGERATFNAVKSLGVDTVETVLLYHVVPGKPILSGDALKANGVALTTAQGGAIRVAVTAKPAIILGDKDPDSRNARVNLSQVDINKGNMQVAHGINRVLRPVNL